MNYEEARDRNKGMISNRIARNAPIQRDVGEIEQAGTQCHGRRGWGHLRRDCPLVTAGKGR